MKKTDGKTHNGRWAAGRTAILSRRDRIAQMYLRGETQVEIARVLDTTQKTVSVELKAMREEWQRSALVAFDARKAEELAKIDNLEKVAWEEFANSKKPQREVSKRVRKALRDKLEAELQAVSGPEQNSTQGNKKGSMKGTKIVAKMAKQMGTTEKEMVAYEETIDRRRVVPTAGEVRWLMVVQWCIDKRCAILGLVRPPDVKVENNLNLVNWDSIHETRAEGDPVEERIQEAEVLAISGSSSAPE